MLRKRNFSWRWHNSKLDQCEAHVHRAFADLSLAERSRGDNKLYYRFQRTRGNDYMQQFRDAKDAAIREFDSAKEELKKAEADYKKAVEDSR